MGPDLTLGERKYALYNKNTGRLVGLRDGLATITTEGFMPSSNTHSRPISNEQYAQLRLKQSKRLTRNSPDYQ
jgi:hypothetical protein